MMTVAIYVRVSTDAQAEQGTSLDTQIDACRKKAIDLGYDLSQKEVIYRDEGESGADIDRPALNKLRDDVESGIINEAIICFDPDRLSRKLNYQLILEEEFTSHGVKLLFVNSDNKRETPEGMLLFHMQGAVAEYERTKIKERTIRGKLAKAKQGQIMPMRTPPYGYTWKDGKLEINNDEVEAVRLIFSWYTQGYTMRQIGEKLIAEGYEARFGKWNASTIRNIINSETYIGRYWYNRRKHERLQAKTKSGYHAIKEKKRPVTDHILIEVPSIIEETIWHKAQAQKTKNTIHSLRNTKLEYLARGGYLRCADCGRVLQNTSYTSRSKESSRTIGCYRCPNLNPRSYGTEKCPSSSIKSQILDDIIWNDLVQAYTKPENMKSSDETDNSSTIKKEREYLQSQLEKISKEKEKIRIMFRKDLMTEKEMEDDLRPLLKREQNIKSQLNSLLDQEVNTKTMTEEEKNELFKLIEPFLKNEATFEDKQFVFQHLTDSIEIKLRKGTVEMRYKGVFDFISKHEYDRKKDSI